MSTPSGEVVLVTKMTSEAVGIMQQLTSQAIERAIWRAKDDIAAFAATDASRVPIDTGRLRSSFMISNTPRYLAMKWSAIDPKTGFDYALVQDVGRVNMAGNAYSQIVKFEAHRILIAHLYAELLSIGAVLP